MKILVTGGAGFIGSVVTSFLIDHGFTVNILDNLSTGNKRFIDPRSNFIHGDILDPHLVNFAMKGCEAVIHLAGKAIVSESIQFPNFYVQQNYIGTKNVLQVMLKNQIHRIVFASSCSVYGESKSDLISETNETKPINPYGKTKLLADKELTKFATDHNFSCISLRFFNVAGSYTNLEKKVFGESHLDETHLIPRILTQSNFEIFGNNLKTKDGTCIRDFVHVVDLASAILLCLSSNARPGHQIYNLGSGIGYSVAEVITLVESIFHKKISIKYSARRLEDPLRLVSDSTYAEENLKWKKQFNLECMIRDTWKFIIQDLAK